MAMDIKQLLMLDKIASTRLSDLASAEPELFREIRWRAATRAKLFVRASRGTVSNDLYQRLIRLDFARLIEPGADIGAMVIEQLRAQDLPLPLLAEAETRIARLRTGGVVPDAAALAQVSVAEHPLLRDEQQRIAVAKLAEIANLPDDKSIGCSVASAAPKR